MLKQFGGDRLATLTLFYDKGEDMLVLNREHKYYEQYRRIVELYMQSPVEAQELLDGQGESKPIEELRHVLDSCALIRHNSWEMFILGNQPLAGCYGTDVGNIFQEIIGKAESKGFQARQNIYFLMPQAYTYGVIQGKRADRARRKAGAAE